MRFFLATIMLATVTASPATDAGPVQVFILMGQSNMLGEGTVEGTTNGTLQFAVETEHKYPYLWDKSTKDWAVSKNVRNVFVMGSGGPTSATKLQHNEFMTVNTTIKKFIGPELGIGWGLGMNQPNTPIMTLKTCIGDRALGWDLLPPGSPSFDWTNPKTNTTYTYAGYHQSPSSWVKGTTPKPIGWEAGIQYDGDTARADKVLADLGTYYPGAKGYEVAGFFWWQGDRDSRSEALSQRYEYNLVNLIKTLRKRYKAPNAKFVTASLGQTVKGSTDGGGLILDAMLAVDGTSGKYPEFKGNVATVYSHPLSMGSSSGAHYGRNAETYMNVGQAMGAAMVGLLKGEQAALQ